MKQRIDAFGWNPFPGLRLCNDTEDFLFFGRDGQISEVLRRLKRYENVVDGAEQAISESTEATAGKADEIRSLLAQALH
jgi:hypothetical protein